MEDPVYKNSTAEIQNENVSMMVDTAGLLSSKAVSPLIEISPKNKENTEIMVKNEPKNEVNGYTDISCESSVNSDSMCESKNEKTHSPTLIESALKVMKNLFSPEKAKCKSTSTLSPSSSLISDSGSPCSSKSFSGKPDVFALEPETKIGIQNNAQVTPGENGYKNNFHSESEMTQSNLDNDESFMTTVSIIDDSFHSAVTHFDEHGDSLKNGNSLKDNFSSNSQYWDLTDSFNDTLEYNESCLENTTLKIDNSASDGISLSNFSVPDKDVLTDNMDSTHIDGEMTDNSKNVSVVPVQYGNSSEKNEKDLKSEIMTEESKEETTPDVGFQEKSNNILPTDNNTEIKHAVDVADIFLNKSFPKTHSKQNKVHANGFNNVKEESEGNFSESEGDTLKNVEEKCVTNSISTTTVVLSTAESADLENMLTSLKTDDSSTIFSSLTCSEEDNVICSLESLIPDSDINGDVQTSNFYLSMEQKRSCVSENNSPDRPGSPKIKLNKSDEFISSRIVNERIEKKLNSDSSSVDFSLMKSSEASDPIKFPQNCKQFATTEADKNQEKSPSGELDSVSLVSQQSYTIITVHDKSLNRPVIEPLRISNEKQPFQVNESNETFLLESANVEKRSNNSTNSIDADDFLNTDQVQQSTPLWEENNEITLKKCRPTLKLHSPKTPEPICKDSKIIENIEESDLSNKTPVQIPPANDLKSAENVGDKSHQVHKNLTPKKQNKTSPGVKSRSNNSKKSPNGTSGKVAKKLNETFDKKQQSPGPKSHQKHEKLNTNSPTDHTLGKELKSPFISNKSHSLDEQSNSSGQDKLSATFNINTISPGSNETFTKETPEAIEGNLTFNKSESPEFAFLNKTFNKSFNSQPNETFSKKTNSPGSQKIFKFPTPCKMIPGSVESPRNETNETFVKDNNCLEIKEAEQNKTFDIVSPKESDIFYELPALDLKVENNLIKENKTSEKKTESFEVFQKLTPNGGQPHWISNASNDENLHYRISEANESFLTNKSSNSSLLSGDTSTVLFNEGDGQQNQTIDELSGRLSIMNLNENLEQIPECMSFIKDTVEKENVQTEENSSSFLKDDKMKCDSDLVELIREHFSSNDIEKIYNVVQGMPALKLSNDVLKANEEFEKSFHGNFIDADFKSPQFELSNEKALTALSPQSLDFLNSIRGKPTGRDLSRYSLYVKFDPLVQPSINSLIDFTKEGEALAADDTSPANPHSSSICEQLLTISPEKKPDAIVPPLTPLSHKVKADLNEDKLERLKELQNEIYFLKNLYAERERSNKAKIEDYENEIAKLTGESCMLEDKLKESNEREKSLVKKIREQTQSIGQLKIIMEEYGKVISKLSSELETIKSENSKQLESLTQEKDSYMTHLQNTEAAFTDVHTKYEKSKKTIVSLKANETLYRNTITEQMQKIEEFKIKAREAQDKALTAFQKIQDELNDIKISHSQEAARLKAQLRKTELKVEALKESLDQKIKENQQLTAICDELIEGKK